MLIAAVLVTVSVIKIDCGLLDAPVELIVRFPEYAPAPSPAGLTEMLRFAGVVPLFGVTSSQLPPEVVVAEAVKAKAAPLLPTDTFCPPGTTPPVW
jgi:hypothetical protein